MLVKSGSGGDVAGSEAVEFIAANKCLKQNGYRETVVLYCSCSWIRCWRVVPHVLYHGTEMGIADERVFLRYELGIKNIAADDGFDWNMVVQLNNKN
ncbi:hypothetical protein C5167_016150 [Papaver somniferum]|nr:hypothetical protein C5167_016150 [Papaver somniferum]